MSRLCSAIWPRKHCIHLTDPSKTTSRCLSTSLPRTSNEQVLGQSSHSPRTQNTAEELVRYFDDSNLNQSDDIRKLDDSLPNRPFRRSRQPSFQAHTNTQTQPNQRRPPTYDGYSFRKLDLGASPPSEAETQTAPQTLDNALPNRPFRGSRQPSTQARSNTQTQLIQRTPVEPDSYTFRKLDLGASPPSEAEAQTAPPTQEPNRPLFRYDNNREPPSTTNERPSTHPQRPPRAGALDLRNLSAQPAPNRPPFQRPPPRQTTPNRSRGVGSDARRPGGTEAARKAPSSTPRSRPRQPRTNASSQRPNIYNSKDADRGLSEEQLAYMREKEEAKAPKPQPYVPAAVSLESLSGLGPGLPAFGVGAWGQEEAVADWAQGWERRSLRKRIRSGVWLDEVETFRGAAGMGDEGRKGETGGKQDANEEGGVNGEVLRREFDGRKIAERMFRGEYVFDGKQEEGVMGTLRRQAVRNGTYFPQDGQSLAEKVRSLLPAEMTGGGGRSARA